MIQTSYFGNLVNLTSTVIAICGKSPEWFYGKGFEYKKLAPRWAFFKDYKDGIIGPEEYTRLYHELVVGKLDPNVVLRELIELNGGSDDIVLVCYETPNEFCHRNLVAKWLSDNCGITITEANYNGSRKESSGMSSDDKRKLRVSFIG